MIEALLFICTLIIFLDYFNKSFLKNDNNEVLIPDQFEKLTEFILNKEYVTEKLLMVEFKDIPKEHILECIRNLKNMKVLL